MTAQHREAVSSIMYCILERRGFAALISRPGMGKTSVILYLVEAMRRSACIALLVHPYLDASSAVESIFRSLGLSLEASLSNNYHKFYEFLLELETRKKPCVVIVDEAQGLSSEALEALRILSNFENANRKLLQIIFVGQPELARTLAAPKLEQLRQRIAILARLEPLSAPEVKQYVEHRLAVAGSTEMPFSPDSLAAIAEHSRGIPRNINTLGFASMTLAFALGVRQVELKHVREAIRDLDVASFTQAVERTDAGAATPFPELQLFRSVPGITEPTHVSVLQILGTAIMVSLVAVTTILLVGKTLGQL
jgi:general secretion pathway protein A